MKVRYFAWVRERTGVPEEEISPPEGVRTIADLIGYLKGRGEGYAVAFERPEVIRAAIDRRHVPHETPISGASEVALFPPMTGG